ncbi:MAG TPA: enoyl-CoA hydratase-related protein [Candidatus Binataceae bacterium]|nr:enoyl-CoA hydratase-related protein [Candidatus Binataceae bacterium]
MSVLLYEVRDHVAHLTLNRPEAANALNYELAAALEEASLKCGEDPAVRAVLITGAGKLFCGGGDLKSFAAQPPAELPGHLKKVTLYLHAAIQRFARMKAPVVIAVNGNAGGAGLSIALTGDLVLAGESTRFTVAYTRIGLTPDGSSSYYLPRLVGLKRALELMLTNRTVTAREAEVMGMITRVVPDAELLSQAEVLARELAQGPTQAFGGVKRLLYASSNNPLYEQMELETEVIADLSRTADAREGIASFLGKRAAKFNGN